MVWLGNGTSFVTPGISLSLGPRRAFGAVVTLCSLRTWQRQGDLKAASSTPALWFEWAWQFAGYYPTNTLAFCAASAAGTAFTQVKMRKAALPLALISAPSFVPQPTAVNMDSAAVSPRADFPVNKWCSRQPPSLGCLNKLLWLLLPPLNNIPCGCSSLSPVKISPFTLANFTSWASGHTSVDKPLSHLAERLYTSSPGCCSCLQRGRMQILTISPEKVPHFVKRI